MRNDLADAIRGGNSMVIPTRARVAVVTGLTPLEVNMDGQAGLSASRCSRYTPALNDIVLVLQLEPDLVIIDSLVSGG